MIFITISEELNYQFVFSFPPHFSKLYMYYIYIYWTSYFDLIVDSSNVKHLQTNEFFSIPFTKFIQRHIAISFLLFLNYWRNKDILS